MIGHTLEKFVGIASVGKVQTKKGNWKPEYFL